MLLDDTMSVSRASLVNNDGKKLHNNVLVFFNRTRKREREKTLLTDSDVCHLLYLSAS